MSDKTKAYRRYAIMTVFNNYASMKKLGNKVCDILKETTHNEIKVSEAKDSNVILKYPRGIQVTVNDLMYATAEAMKDIIKDSDGLFQSHVSDTYEFDYDPNFIDKNFVDEVYSFNVSGKTMMIELED